MPWMKPPSNYCDRIDIVTGHAGDFSYTTHEGVVHFKHIPTQDLAPVNIYDDGGNLTHVYCGSLDALPASYNPNRLLGAIEKAKARG